MSVPDLPKFAYKEWAFDGEPGMKRKLNIIEQLEDGEEKFICRPAYSGPTQGGRELTDEDCEVAAWITALPKVVVVLHDVLARHELGFLTLDTDLENRIRELF